ncbi:3-deoxy-D-manno-octulosonic acid transferase [Hyphococcus luteus]|uniref:3-deoxy-D-manno-octulosonic acid transferase n=1 Tax=Hyphococcus luteus TaxID=2058213 RepID=A0A2S7K3L8_9PROT|nr:3-deoxy-D-manno-octulosonic acid transferase [Marinicaulis flavus]PQA87087.1 3-deoxy-D-manno-octulosonic acid transferase [Marinicaulis flavus]
MNLSAREPLGLKIYRTVSRVGAPVASFALKRRLRAGKEDPARIEERKGHAGRARPDGPLVWIHGASVGESLSVLPLVERLKAAHPDCAFLVTTGTVTSAKLMEERLPAGAFHQFIPLDHPDYVDAFLDHWKPDAALFVESEFWPNLVLGARAKTRFMALVNGRISPRSFEDWRRQPNAIRFILSSFDVIVAQDPQNAERLSILSGRSVETFGNLKYAAPPLPADEAALADLESKIGPRTRWLAASTHPREEETILAAAKMLKAEFPDLLTIIAPRHPTRGDDVAALCEAQGLKPARRAAGDPVGPDTDIYIADTLGELGLFYRLCNVSFVGGSLVDKGGHNPLEPARLGAAILHGPHVFNFVETYREMRKTGGAALVRNDREIASAVRRLFADAKTRSAMTMAAQKAAEDGAERILGDVCKALDPHLEKSVAAA